MLYRNVSASRLLAGVPCFKWSGVLTKAEEAVHCLDVFALSQVPEPAMKMPFWLNDTVLYQNVSFPFPVLSLVGSRAANRLLQEWPGFKWSAFSQGQKRQFIVWVYLLWVKFQNPQWRWPFWLNETVQHWNVSAVSYSCAVFSWILGSKQVFAMQECPWFKWSGLTRAEEAVHNLGVFALSQVLESKFTFNPLQFSSDYLRSFLFWQLYGNTQ